MGCKFYHDKGKAQPWPFLNRTSHPVRHHLQDGAGVYQATPFSKLFLCIVQTRLGALRVVWLQVLVYIIPKNILAHQTRIKVSLFLLINQSTNWKSHKTWASFEGLSLGSKSPFMEKYQLFYKTNYKGIPYYPRVQSWQSCLSSICLGIKGKYHTESKR